MTSALSRQIKFKNTYTDKSDLYVSKYITLEDVQLSIKYCLQHITKDVPSFNMANELHYIMYKSTVYWRGRYIWYTSDQFKPFYTEEII